MSPRANDRSAKAPRPALRTDDARTAMDSLPSTVSISVSVGSSAEEVAEEEREAEG
jgi:hypothetical protein